MNKLRKLPVVLCMLVGVGFAADKGQATVISYQSDGIVELDLFKKWIETGGNPDMENLPSRAALAALYIEFPESLQPNTLYSDTVGPYGETPISINSVSVETDERAYGLFPAGPYLQVGWNLWFETDSSARVTDFNLDLYYGFGPDFVDLEADLKLASAEWRYEYFDPDLNDGLGGVTGTGGSGGGDAIVNVGPTAASLVTPVPLPAGLLLLGSGVILFGFGAKMRKNS